MLTCDYLVLRIDGDYAELQRVDAPFEIQLVARALLPDAIREGTRLHFEMLQYTIID